MAHIVSARVYETSVTSGTGPVSLSGAVNGNFRFGDVMTIGDTCDYIMFAGANAEEGIGTYSGTNTLSRTQVLRSTNGNAAVNWGTETKFIGLVVAASRQRDAFTRLPRGHITGLKMSAAGGANTFSIGEGQATADAAPYPLLQIPTGWTKSLGGWSQGSGGGSVDTGTASANAWRHVYLMGRLDGVTDITATGSFGAPTLPSGWIWKRYIGSIRADGSTNVRAFTQYGNLFLWTTPSVDATNQAVGTTPVFIPLLVPPIAGISARFRANALNATANASMSLMSPVETPTTAGTGGQSLFATAVGTGGHFELTVDSLGRIKAVSNHASTTTTILTYAWESSRGQDD